MFVILTGKGICDEVNPCKNGGICTGNSVNHPCLCQAGFTGSYCEGVRCFPFNYLALFEYIGKL